MGRTSSDDIGIGELDVLTGRKHAAMVVAEVDDAQHGAVKAHVSGTGDLHVDLGKLEREPTARAGGVWRNGGEESV